MKLRSIPGHIRNIRSTGRWAATRFIHPDASVCRRSKLEFPCRVEEACKLTQVHLGRYSYVARDTRILDCDIGAYSSIGPGCLIGGLGRHPTDHFSTSPLTYSPGNRLSRVLGSSGYDLKFEENARVSIGPDVWIGARVIVADGVKIGLGAVIGANTVVTKDVPPYAVYFGSPAEIRRFRFPPEVIARLTESVWWTKSPTEIDTQALLKLIQ